MASTDRYKVTNDGQVKVNFSLNPADPNYWEINLVGAAAPLVVEPPKPFVYSVDTDWPHNIPLEQRNDDNILMPGNEIPGDHGEFDRWVENEQKLQNHWWRFDFQYTKSTSSVDEQFSLSLTNPVSSFIASEGSSYLRGNVVDNSVQKNIKTIADGVSLPSQGVGAGYRFSWQSTINAKIVMKSITRESVYKSKVKPW